MSDYGEYNGDIVHDMWVDYSYEMCTGENVTGGYDSGCEAQPKLYEVTPSPEKRSQHEINVCKSGIYSNTSRLLQLEIEIEKIEFELKNSNLSAKRTAHLQTLLAGQREKYDACAEKLRIQEDKLKSLLVEADIEAVKSGNLKVGACCLVAFLLATLLFWWIY